MPHGTRLPVPKIFFPGTCVPTRGGFEMGFLGISNPSRGSGMGIWNPLKSPVKNPQNILNPGDRDLGFLRLKIPKISSIPGMGIWDFRSRKIPNQFKIWGFYHGDWEFSKIRGFVSLEFLSSRIEDFCKSGDFYPGDICEISEIYIPGIGDFSGILFLGMRIFLWDDDIRNF